MSSVESPDSFHSELSRRPLGSLLLDGVFIRDRDLEKALAEQKDTNQLLGQILIKLGALDTDDLSAVLAIQDDTSQTDAALRLAAGIRQRLGELLCDAKRLTQEQVARALDEQKNSGEKLGDVMVRLGYLTSAERDIAIEFQRRQAGEAPTSDKLRLGRILVASGEISQAQIDEALRRMRSTRRRLGEELIASAGLSQERLDRALRLQRRLVIVALIAALSPLNPGFVTSADAGQVKATISVTATVVESVSIRQVHQAQNLVITAQDVERGYVQVSAGSRFDIRNSGFCVFEFRSMNNIFRSVQVTGLDGVADLDSNGGTMLQKSSGTATESIELGYRFELAQGVAPGTYRWPLSLAVVPM